jgi:sugar lactone lactonase YvrE
MIAGATRLANLAPATVAADIHQGFGRINLDAILAPSAPVAARFVDAKQGLITGKIRNYSLKVKSSSSPLRIVLAYSDYPGTKLVNNLNLIVTAPSGKIYVGNGTTGSVLTLDATNNVESIRVTQPQAGTWRVQVVASNVAQGPQDYALVMLGNIKL